MATRPEDTPHAADAVRVLDRMLPQADTVRADGLEALGRMRAAKAAVLERERTRLTQKFGPNDTSVKVISDQIATNQALSGYLAAETLRARTTPVDADPQAWILHGRVLDSQSNPVPNLTIALYDANSRWIESLGYTCTDSTGYFKLAHAMKAVVVSAHEQATGPTAAPAGSRSVPPKSRSADSGPNAASAGGSAEPSGPAFIHVLDSKSATLVADARELTPAAGRVDYVEIVIGTLTSSECASPSGKTRTPPRQPKSKS